MSLPKHSSNRPLSHSKILGDYFQAPSFKRALKASDKARIQVEVSHYKDLSSKKVEIFPFQDKAIQSACQSPKGLWCGELWTGAGKSIIAARISLSFLRKKKKVLFICPNRMGIGDESDGIIQKFHRVFSQLSSASYKIGRLGEASRVNDVNFLTPHEFVNLHNKYAGLFKALVNECGLLIVDEAHHFPEDPQEHQMIYGKVEKIASKYFINEGKKVVTLTATHGRSDGKFVFKKEKPHFQITVHDAIQMGYCPEIHGLPVFLDTKAPRAQVKGEDYNLNLDMKATAEYFRQIVAVMLEVQKLNEGKQFCAFVRTIAEAEYLQKVWNNEAARRGYKPVALLTGYVPHSERAEIRKAIQNQEYVGYVTCDVGSESIDIPRLEIVHLIRRTRSVNKLVQSIGRALRMHPDKSRTLIVDYNVSELKILRACKGLEEYAIRVGGKPSAIVSGGPIIAIEGSLNAEFSGVTVDNERQWLVRSLAGGFIPHGEVFGRLTVVRDHGYYEVHCVCECGKKSILPRHSLRAGLTKSCGCIREPFGPLKPGENFGYLTVLKDHASYKVECQCKCGVIKIFYRSPLRNGVNRACSRSCQFNRPYALNPGERFGLLTVLSDDGDQTQVRCICKCGKRVIAGRNPLRKGQKKSCGCTWSGNGDPSRRLKAGQRIGYLTILSDKGWDKVRWRCRCGKERVGARANIKKMGPNASCRCVGRKPTLIGSTYGCFTIIADKGYNHVTCRCKCGRIVIRNRQNIRKLLSRCDRCPRSPIFHKGKRFADWKVIRYDQADKILCKCTCGTMKFKTRGCLIRGESLGCSKCRGSRESRLTSLRNAVLRNA